MSNEKSIKNMSFNFNVLLFVSAIGMVATSIYLTNHYFQTHFPTGTGLKGTGLCEINSFFSCDKATTSNASNFFGIPISFFGILNGVLILCGYLFTSEKTEKTIYNYVLINGLLCGVLLLYSLFALGGLCPFCTVYYVLSCLALFVFYKNSTFSMPDVKTFLIIGVAFIIPTIGMHAYVLNLEAEKDKKASNEKQVGLQMVAQYKGLDNLGRPKMDSPFLLAKSTEKFTDAPIQVVIFSDFQCPACKMLTTVVHEMAEKYEGKINIQYFFYPLDHNCNPEMKRPLHAFACQASYLAYCLPKKFGKVHDDIFFNQDNLSQNWLESYAKKENVLECMKSEDTKAKVIAMINQSKPFNISSTPTMLLNGVKIEGVIPLNSLTPILDMLIEEHGKK